MHYITHYVVLPEILYYVTIQTFAQQDGTIKKIIWSQALFKDIHPLICWFNNVEQW